MSGEIDCDMRKRGNKSHLREGSIVTRADGVRVQVVRWEPGFNAWRVWCLDGQLAGREVLFHETEATQ